MIKVVYNEKQVADPGKQTLELQGYTPSPSAKKPMEVAQQLRSRKNIEFVDPVALSIEDIKLVHDPEYVDGIFSLKLENGFGTISQSVVDSLPYTIPPVGKSGPLTCSSKSSRDDSGLSIS